jgi:hypothetical protein
MDDQSVSTQSTYDTYRGPLTTTYATQTTHAADSTSTSTHYGNIITATTATDSSSSDYRTGSNSNQGIRSSNIDKKKPKEQEEEDKPALLSSIESVIAKATQSRAIKAIDYSALTATECEEIRRYQRHGHAVFFLGDIHAKSISKAKLNKNSTGTGADTGASGTDTIAASGTSAGISAGASVSSQSNTGVVGINEGGADNAVREVDNKVEKEVEVDPGHDDSGGNYVANPGDHIAFRYEIMDSLGMGSFGVVFHCKDHKTMRDVAIKVTYIEL